MKTDYKQAAYRYRAILFSLALHLLILLLIFYIFPEFFNKRKNINIAVDIITIQEFLKNPLPSAEKNSRNLDYNKNDKLTEKGDSNIKSLDKKKIRKVTKKTIITKNKKIIKKIRKPLKGNVPIKSDKGNKLLNKNKVGDLTGEDFSSVLGEIKKVQAAQKEKIDRENFIYGSNLTPGERAGIKRQINFCWYNLASKLFNMNEIRDIKIKVIVDFSIDGDVLNAKLAEPIADYMTLDNDLYRKVADTALSTFYRCHKINNMPKNKFKAWKTFEFIFDPTNPQY
jgi:hypothetical protein